MACVFFYIYSLPCAEEIKKISDRIYIFMVISIASVDFFLRWAANAIQRHLTNVYTCKMISTDRVSNLQVPGWGGQRGNSPLSLGCIMHIIHLGCIWRHDSPTKVQWYRQRFSFWIAQPNQTSYKPILTIIRNIEQSGKSQVLHMFCWFHTKTADSCTILHLQVCSPPTHPDLVIFTTKVTICLLTSE